MDDITNVRYKSYDWGRPFDPKEYKNAKAITMLYESWLQSSRELEGAKETINHLNARVDSLEKKFSDLDKEQAILTVKLGDYKRRKWFPFAIQILATLCIGLGINWISNGGTTVFYGWIFVFLTVVFEVIAFFINNEDN
jgi:hypothetical protein